MQVTLKPRPIVLALGAMVAFLAIADGAVLWVKFRWNHDYLYGLTPFFDLNLEGNLPSFYSACTLLFAALLFLVIAGDARERHDPWRRHWTGLGVIFLFLSVDEAAEIHGLLSLPVSRLAHTSGALLFAWVIPYALLTVLFVITYLRFFWALPRRLRALVGIAGVIYVIGALGLESVGGVIVSAHGGLEGGGLGAWQHAVEYSVEEVMEMTGIVLTIHALLEHIAARGITLSLRVAAE